MVNPRVTLHAIKSSMREIPVTISEFRMGILVIPIHIVFVLGFMALMPIEAAVPSRVARRADTRAMTSVLYKADIIASSWNKETYQERVKPPHLVLDLEALKDRTTKVTMGAYMRKRIRPK